MEKIKKQILKFFLLLVIFFVAPGFVKAAISFDQNGKWETTFNCSDWMQNDNLSCDSISNWGAWVCSPDPVLGLSASNDQITIEANNSLGTGKGFRHWIGNEWDTDGDGSVDKQNGGGLAVTFPVLQKELWIRFYARYQSGFAWDVGYPYFNKILYIYTNAPGLDVIPGFAPGDILSLTAQGLPSGKNYPVTTTHAWQEINGGALGDGNFHIYELHIKMDTDQTDGIGELWVDGILRASNYAVDWSNGNETAKLGWVDFGIGSNAVHPAGSSPCQYMDYDDMTIYNTTPPNLDSGGNPFIGPIILNDTTAPSAPTGLGVQ